MKRILFVDDEPLVLDGLRDLFRKQRREWDMVFAPGGPEGIEALGALTQAAREEVEGATREAEALLRRIRKTERALQIAADHPGGVDILISDMMMPGMTGYELFQELSARQPTLKCLFTSGYPANVILERCAMDDGVHFLQKPFSRQALADKIRDTLK